MSIRKIVFIALTLGIINPLLDAIAMDTPDMLMNEQQSLCTKFTYIMNHLEPLNKRSNFSIMDQDLNNIIDASTFKKFLGINPQDPAYSPSNYPSSQPKREFFIGFDDSILNDFYNHALTQKSDGKLLMETLGTHDNFIVSIINYAKVYNLNFNSKYKMKNKDILGGPVVRAQEVKDLTSNASYGPNTQVLFPVPGIKEDEGYYYESYVSTPGFYINLLSYADDINQNMISGLTPEGWINQDIENFSANYKMMQSQLERLVGMSEDYLSELRRHLDSLPYTTVVATLIDLVKQKKIDVHVLTDHLRMHTQDIQSLQQESMQVESQAIIIPKTNWDVIWEDSDSEL